MLDFFDDKTDSDTRGEQVTRCSGCGLWLYYGLGTTQPSNTAQGG
jgi:hypothetical protein